MSRSDSSSKRKRDISDKDSSPRKKLATSSSAHDASPVFTYCLPQCLKSLDDEEAEEKRLRDIAAEAQLDSLVDHGVGNIHLHGSENSILQAIRLLDKQRSTKAPVVFHAGSLIPHRLVSPSRPSKARRQKAAKSETDSAVEFASSPASTVAALSSHSGNEPLASEAKPNAASSTLPTSSLAAKPAVIQNYTPVEYHTGLYKIDLSDSILCQPEFLFFLMQSYELHAISVSSSPPGILQHDVHIQSARQHRLGQAVNYINSVTNETKIGSPITMKMSESLLGRRLSSSATELSLSDLDDEVGSLFSSYTTYSSQLHYVPYLVRSADAFISQLLEKAPALDTCLYLKDTQTLLLGGPKTSIFQVLQFINSLMMQSKSQRGLGHCFDAASLHSPDSIKKLAQYYQHRLPLESLVCDWLIRHWEDATYWLQVRFSLSAVTYKRGEMTFCGDRGAIEEALSFFADVVEKSIAFKIDARWKDEVAEYVDLLAGSINPPRHRVVRNSSSSTSSSSIRDAKTSSASAESSRPASSESVKYPLTNHSLYRYVYSMTKQQVEMLRKIFGDPDLHLLRKECHLSAMLASSDSSVPSFVRMEGTKDSILAAVNRISGALLEDPLYDTQPHRFDVHQLRVLLLASQVLDEKSKKEWTVAVAAGQTPTGPRQQSNHSRVSSNPRYVSNSVSVAPQPAVKPRTSSPFAGVVAHAQSVGLKKNSVKAMDQSPLNDTGSTPEINSSAQAPRLPTAKLRLQVQSGDPFATIVAQTQLAALQKPLPKEKAETSLDDPNVLPVKALDSEEIAAKPEPGPLQLRHSLRRLKFSFNKPTKRHSSPVKIIKDDADDIEPTSEVNAKVRRSPRSARANKLHVLQRVVNDEEATDDAAEHGESQKPELDIKEEILASVATPDQALLNASRESTPLSDLPQDEEESASDFDLPVDELKASNPIENNILREVPAGVHASSESYVKSHIDQYKPYFKGPGSDMVQLEYPAHHETYLLHKHIRKNDNDEYNPVEEAMSIIQLVLNNFMVQEDRTSFKSKGKALLTTMEKAYSKCNKADFLDSMEEYNKTLRRMKQSGKIRDYLKCMPSIPSEVALFITEQAYQRIVSPKTHILRRYLAFSDNVYGELLPSLLLSMFKATNLSSNQTFVDLGSGVGNAVILAALATGCESHGYENMTETHQIASDHVDEIKARCTLFGLSPGHMEAHCADFTEDPNAAKILQKADVVLANNYLFGPETTEKLLNLFLDLKDGTYIISLKPFIDSRAASRPRTSDHGRARLQDFILEQVAAKTYPRNSVSWSGQSGKWYISRIKNRSSTPL